MSTLYTILVNKGPKRCGTINGTFCKDPGENCDTNQKPHLCTRACGVDDGTFCNDGMICNTRVTPNACTKRCDDVNGTFCKDAGYLCKNNSCGKHDLLLKIVK